MEMIEGAFSFASWKIRWAELLRSGHASSFGSRPRATKIPGSGVSSRVHGSLASTSQLQPDRADLVGAQVERDGVVVHDQRALGIFQEIGRAGLDHPGLEGDL